MKNAVDNDDERRTANDERRNDGNDGNDGNDECQTTATINDGDGDDNNHCDDE